MKVLFVGPSLAGVDYPGDGLEIQGPAANGDLTRAVLAGARIIGLVDGVFGSVAAVWHKEILFALSEGVRVLGAASMGALRAAECAQFGMEPVGVIANRFLEGSLDDDAAVALTHMPGELGWGALSEPLVDVEATLDALRDRALITAGEFTALNASAAAIFFKRRSIEAIVAAADVAPARGETLRTSLHSTGAARRPRMRLNWWRSCAPPNLDLHSTRWAGALAEPPDVARASLAVARRRATADARRAVVSHDRFTPSALGSTGESRSGGSSRVRLQMNFLMQSTVPGEAPSGVERSAASVLSRLTPREQQVAWLVSSGETSKSIGRELGISFRTVEVHRAKIMTKLGVHSLAELVRLIGRRWPASEPLRHPLPGSQA